MSDPLPAGSPHPWHIVGAVGNTAWHPAVDHWAPVLTMEDRPRDWRWQGARHKVHYRATSYKRTSHLSEWASSQGQPSSAFRPLWPFRISLAFSFPICKTATLLPYLWNCDNELINESTDAVSDSDVTEPRPGWGA